MLRVWSLKGHSLQSSLRKAPAPCRAGWQSCPLRNSASMLDTGTAELPQSNLVWCATTAASMRPFLCSCHLSLPLLYNGPAARALAMAAAASAAVAQSQASLLSCSSSTLPLLSAPLLRLLASSPSPLFPLLSRNWPDERKICILPSGAKTTVAATFLPARKNNLFARPRHLPARELTKCLLGI